MPLKKYRDTDYARAAKRRAKKKVLQVTFELNMAQSEMAKKLDPEDYDATSIHTLAKKLFLDYLEESN